MFERPPWVIYADDPAKFRFSYSLVWDAFQYRPRCSTLEVHFSSIPSGVARMNRKRHDHWETHQGALLRSRRSCGVRLPTIYRPESERFPTATLLRCWFG